MPTPWLAVIRKPWVVALAVLLALALAFQLGRCDGVGDERSRQNAMRAEANAAAVAKDSAAKEAAATQRAADNTRIDQAGKVLKDALKDIPDTAPDAVRVRLACQRLRSQGTSEAALPTPCRSQR